MIKGADIEFRLIRNDEDEILFQSLKDWPPDRIGPITRKRAMEVIDQAMKQHEYVDIPITDDSDFFITFVITSGPADGPIGTTQGRIKNRSAYISWISFMPEHRGAGLFKETHFCWSELAFNVMGCDRIIVVAKPTIIPVTQLFDRYTGGKEAPRIGRFDSDEPKEKWVHTKAEYQADFAREGGYKDKRGRPLTFTFDAAKAPVKPTRLARHDGRPSLKDLTDVDPANLPRPDVTHDDFPGRNAQGASEERPVAVAVELPVPAQAELPLELPEDVEELPMADGRGHILVPRIKRG